MAAQALRNSQLAINDAIEQADKHLSNPLIDKSRVNVLNYYSAMTEYMMAVESNDNRLINTAQKNMRNILNGKDSYAENDIYFQEAKKSVEEFLGHSGDNSQNMLDTLKASGGEYEIVVNANACKECERHSQSGKLSEIGNITLPPYHPNCKCKVEIYDSNDNIVYETPEKQYTQNNQAHEEDYLTKSMKQVLLGNYANETTALGTAGQIALGLTGLDVAADARDLMYDITHWKNDWSHLGQTLLDGVGLIPLVGALKNIDEATDLLKHGDDVVESVSDAAKRSDDVVESVGKYTEKIKWGINEIDVRPYGEGYWGTRIQQTNPRVDAYELKINPNNESFYLRHPRGGFVQFENVINDIVQDGKLIIQQKKSFYHVENLPPFAKNKVLQEAIRQIEAVKEVDYTIEWLVSDEKAAKQLTKLFINENINITVKYFPE